MSSTVHSNEVSMSGTKNEYSNSSATLSVRPKENRPKSQRKRNKAKKNGMKDVNKPSNDSLWTTRKTEPQYSIFKPNDKHNVPQTLNEGLKRWKKEQFGQNYKMPNFYQVSQNSHIAPPENDSSRFNYSAYNLDYNLIPSDRQASSTESCLGILHAKMTPEKKPECAFCKRNNSKDINHLLKDSSGGVVCPVLSAFTCKMCAATGRNAHTHKYCPINPITKGDPVAAGMPPGRPLTKEDKQWLKYFHAKYILDLYFRDHFNI